MTGFYFDHLDAEIGAKVVSKKGFTYAQLKTAFDDLTLHMDNWKNPIRSFVLARTFDMYSEACEFFTGSILEIDEVAANGKLYYVSADGYYRAVGA